MNQDLQLQVREVVELLATGKYSDLETLTKGTRLTAQEMAKAIQDYHRELIVPPKDAFDKIDVIEVRNAQPPRWSVCMPLWTREEGLSDLSLELTIIRTEKGFEIELDDIRVL